MERREGFFEKLKRGRTARQTAREAGLALLEAQIRGSFAHNLEQSTQALQRETNRIKEAEKRKTIRIKIAGTIEMGKMGSQGIERLQIPEFRAQYLRVVNSLIVHQWRTDRTRSIQAEVMDAAAFIGLEDEIAGFTLRGIQYALTGEPSQTPEEDRYLTEADLKAIFVATGASVEETRIVFRETPRR